jgi:hypothetical protein
MHGFGSCTGQRVARIWLDGVIAIAWRGALHDYDWAEANQSRSPGALTGRTSLPRRRNATLEAVRQ